MQSPDILSQPTDTPPKPSVSNDSLIQKIAVNKNSWYISLWLLVSVVTITLGMAVFGYFQKWEIVSLTDQIHNLQSSIDEAAKNKDILIAKILDEGNIRPSIDLKKQIGNFKTIATDAQVEFQGFSISNDHIKTTLIATADWLYTIDPVQTVIAMIRSHNKNTQVLSLQPIRSLSGNPKKRMTSIDLLVTK